MRHWRLAVYDGDNTAKGGIQSSFRRPSPSGNGGTVKGETDSFSSAGDSLESTGRCTRPESNSYRPRLIVATLISPTKRSDACSHHLFLQLISLHFYSSE
ncbi:hypothetical protein HNY73_021445 [Argiope bruennichi]|uniref:Uncharacterized protein n=1 Tax=Argiope bruennichi TaxID=94029 RepID=A0A8T0DYJ8_ARGBR|nr:hypothetical protein HNY73_021445 [Argiope bruennichi]